MASAAGPFSFFSRIIGDDPLEAQRKFQLEQDWKASRAAMEKAETDVRNGIASGKTDSHMKSINASFKNAGSLSY